MKINKKNLGDHLIEYQLNMIGKTIQDIIDDQQWYSNNTMTKEQMEIFKIYAIPLIKKVYRCSEKKAIGLFSWFDLQYGLRII